MDSPWVYVQTRDAKGTVLEEGWEYDAPADRYEANGLAELEPYVEKLLGSNNWYSTVSVLTLDDKNGIFLTKTEGVISVGMFIEWRDEPDTEKRVRAFFKELGIEPTEDYLAGNGGVMDATRVLDYPVEGTAHEITALVQRLATEAMDIPASAGLNLEFEEHEDKRGSAAERDGVSFTITRSRTYFGTAPPPNKP